MALLELIGAVKSWPGMAVKLDLTLGEGELLAIVGPSGCGKSTALRMIAGLTRLDSGEVRIAGADAARLAPRDRGVGMVFQDHALFPHLSVLGNVCYGMSARGVPKRDRLREARQLFESMGLAGFEKRMPASLSGGERQRVALARTLAVRPRIVLFDEPLSSLDAALRKRLRAEIRDSQKRLGLAAIYVTHDLEEAMAIADRVAIMDSGSILQCDEPKALWDSPRDAAVARFLGSGPCLRLERISRRGADGMPLAETAGGSFPLPALARHETSHAAERFVFFGRGDAVPLPEGSGAPSAAEPGASEPGAGSFVARCLRADYAGDAVDCEMDSGGERFSLRFSIEAAPAEGEERRYSVKTGRLRLLALDARIR